jgi:hypothetical protein
MIGLVKIVGLSAVLSAGFVGAYEAPGQASTTGTKTYTDRLPQIEASASNLTVAYASAKQADTAPAAKADSATKGDSLRNGPQNACAGQTWPYISRDCVVAEGAAARTPVRTITIEQRQGANTSVLVRVPATAVATR